MPVKPETKEIIHLILQILATGAVISLAVLAPNAAGPIVKLFTSRGVPPKKARAVIHYLKRHNLVMLRAEGTETVVTMTEEGKRKLLRYDFNTLAIPRPRRWDGRWRLVAFDIPEKKKLAREALRHKLKELGFLLIQKSLWVHPFACSNEINFISETFQISPYLWLIEASRLDHEEYLKKKFSLA